MNERDPVARLPAWTLAVGRSGLISLLDDMATGNDRPSRDHVLRTLAGEPTDRAAVCFEFGPAADRLRAKGIDDPDAFFGVDLAKIWFLPKDDPRSNPPDEPPPAPKDAARVGNAQQVANYRLWGYIPQCIDKRQPLIRAECDGSLESYSFPSIDAPGEAERLRRTVAGYHGAGQAVAGQIPYLGGVIFETAYRLRGLDNLLDDLQTRPDFAGELLDRIAANASRNVAALAAAGCDIIFLGDDIGLPTSMLISPDMWRQWFKPRLAAVIAAARSITPGIPIAYHSDGWFLPVIDDLVEIGVSILNPVQPDCMDPVALRRRYGPRLVLWGTVGSAALMAFGTPRDIHREVRRRIDELTGPGGLILSPAYDLEDNVPVENVEAFFAACR